MTRIASVETHMISLPRPQPVWTAHEESKAWNVILTEVRPMTVLSAMARSTARRCRGFASG